MGIVNRSMDGSEQRDVTTQNLGAFPVTTTRAIYIAPYPVTLEQIRVSATGISGAPQHKIQCTRFITGAGATSFDVVAAGVIPVKGTSGVFSMTLPTAGSSLLSLQAKDVLEVVSSVANTGFDDVLYTTVVKALQDIKTYYGTSVS